MGRVVLVASACVLVLLVLFAVNSILMRSLDIEQQSNGWCELGRDGRPRSGDDPDCEGWDSHVSAPPR